MAQLKHEGISWQEIDGELVILDLVHSVYLTTNVAGAFLTKLLVEERSREDLVTALAQEYSLEEDRASTDVDAFLGLLAERGLLA